MVLTEDVQYIQREEDKMAFTGMAPFKEGEANAERAHNEGARGEMPETPELYRLYFDMIALNHGTKGKKIYICPRWRADRANFCDDWKGRVAQADRWIAHCIENKVDIKCDLEQCSDCHPTRWSHMMEDDRPPVNETPGEVPLLPSQESKVSSLSYFHRQVDSFLCNGISPTEVTSSSFRGTDRNDYVGHWIEPHTGVEGGTVREIVSFDPSLHKVTVSPAWSSAPGPGQFRVWGPTQLYQLHPPLVQGEIELRGSEYHFPTAYGHNAVIRRFSDTVDLSLNVLSGTNPADIGASIMEALRAHTDVLSRGDPSLY